MKKILVGAIAFVLGAGAPGFAQSLDDLNIQIHGYVTQGFLYTTNNNIFTATTSDGSPAWTEAVINVSSQPIPKLRIAVQARYYLLGNFGDAIILDWAAGDYKVDDRFGVSPAESYDAYLTAKCESCNFSEEDLCNWKPPTSARGRRQS